MDKGFETILYIVLGLIFVLAQVAKKKKKAAEAQVAEYEDDSDAPRQTPTSFIEQLLGVPEQKPIVQKPVDNYLTPRESLEISFPQPGPNVGSSSSEDQLLGARLKNVSENFDEHRKSKSGKKTNFDLRTAIIYKAVLERKNF